MNERRLGGRSGTDRTPCENLGVPRSTVWSAAHRGDDPNKAPGYAFEVAAVNIRKSKELGKDSVLLQLTMTEQTSVQFALPCRITGSSARRLAGI